MVVILSHHLTLERLARAFRSREMTAEIIKVEPALPEQGLPRLAYLEVNNADGPPVLIWLDTQIPSLLRLRVVLVTREQPTDPDDPPVEAWVVERSQRQELFGLVSTGKVRQMTLDKRLPYQSAIIDDVIIEAARGLIMTGEAALDIAALFG